MHRLPFLLLLFTLFQSNLYSQRMIYDSLLVDFGHPKEPVNGIKIDTIIDERKENPKFLGVYESTKYLYVPVDRYIAIKKPLADEIGALFSHDDGNALGRELKLTIKEFTLTARSQFFSKKYVTQAMIAVSEVDSSRTYQSIGNLIYEEYAAPKGFKSGAKEGYSASIDVWKQHFSADLVKLSVCPGNDGFCGLPNLYLGSQSLKKNLMPSLEVSWWIDAWLVDGEIIFARPESSKRFFRKAFSLRYRNQPKFQSFEFNFSNDQLNFRLSDLLVTTLKSKLFLGINLWDENEYKHRGFEDIFVLDYSLGQYILINPFGKKGLTGGIGAMASATYVYSEGFDIKPFLTVQMGVKF
ncbi:MAG TPA: hypothetical protein PLO02_09990 [Tenuifilaceae bacterium]|jgi:hypothetical protein|nr:hypothetical protein [Bacteroidales bacterium]NLH56125.1 hypothetical protein [Rikenellaceae bacterium]OQC62253.1 MAG: hypothetical protein BWX49_01920 [Bacteroidetes bacterium ADurb.Bin008]HNV82060.1 hypothetical protein [Tenuifilaceae bacterium]MZP83147.1 hypothetical protein [Bacteroidales bacterium]